MTEDFKYLCSHCIHGKFDEKNKHKEDVERQDLPGQFKESWKDRDFLLTDSSPL
jgi:hypothetical protein